jgi:hypothetical protein
MQSCTLAKALHHGFLGSQQGSALLSSVPAGLAQSYQRCSASHPLPCGRKGRHGASVTVLRWHCFDVATNIECGAMHHAWGARGAWRSQCEPELTANQAPPRTVTSCLAVDAASNPANTKHCLLFSSLSACCAAASLTGRTECSSPALPVENEQSFVQPASTALCNNHGPKSQARQATTTSIRFHAIHL